MTLMTHSSRVDPVFRRRFGTILRSRIAIGAGGQ
jgi:hypothetical protein